MKKMVLLFVLMLPFVLWAQQPDSIKQKGNIPEDPIYGLTIAPSPKNAADLISGAATLRLTGFSVATATSMLFAVGAFDSAPANTRNAVLVASGLASITLYVFGEMMQIKAGRKMNKEALVIEPSDQGIGVVVKF